MTLFTVFHQRKGLYCTYEETEAQQRRSDFSETTQVFYAKARMRIQVSQLPTQ